ncbi:MAG TPA: hypothetical protein VKE98_13150 [Gemmataceae bacterium]|nr:hypothetical protein [Gemmataceae bacterium]
MSATKKEKSKKTRKNNAPLASGATSNLPQVQGKKPRRWLRWLLTAACVFITAVLTYGLVDYVLWPRIPTALVGTWRVQGGPQDGVTLQFQRNGDFQARLKRGEEGAIVHARAEVDGTDEKKLRIVSTDARTKKKITKIHIIRSLTDNELLLEDPTGTVSKLIRQE